AECAGPGPSVETRCDNRVIRGGEAGLLCTAGRRAGIERRGGKPRKTGRQTSLREDELHPPLSELQALMHLSRHGRRAHRAGHAGHQPDHHYRGNHDEDDHLDEADAGTASPVDNGDLARNGAHWTVAFPVTGLTTTVRGPPLALRVMVALLAGAAKLAGCPFVSNSR